MPPPVLAHNFCEGGQSRLNQSTTQNL
jgi:hypothetical protein